MPTTLIIVAAVAILIILLATASYKVCPADRVMVITGPGGRRFVSGGSAFIIPFIMRVDWLSLGAVQSLLRTDTPIPTKDAILIDVNAVANFQIASETMTVDENGKQVKALENAAKNYLNQSKERMEKDVTQVLLGKLREVIGRTELKALMENRDTFAATVAESARVDMERLERRPRLRQRCQLSLLRCPRFLLLIPNPWVVGFIPTTPPNSNLTQKESYDGSRKQTYKSQKRICESGQNRALGYQKSVPQMA